MYSLKPITQHSIVELPSTMYEIKSIYTHLDENNSQINSEPEIVAALEDRQKRILSKLEELKQTLMEMRSGLKLCNKPAQPAHAVVSTAQKKSPAKQIDISLLEDIVVNANPQNIPYVLLALKNLWRDLLTLDVESYLHSSMVEYPEAAKSFSSELASVKNVVKSVPVLKLKIIWKNVAETQMITGSSKYVPIIGEVNVLRFLSRIGPNEFNYEDQEELATSTDAVLDICYQLTQKLSSKERQTHLQQLNQRLGKHKFFNGDDGVSIADVAVSSVLKNSSTVKELPGSLSCWQARTKLIVGY